MKKTAIATITILSFVVFAFAQPATMASDSLKAVQKSETSKLGKKTIVMPPPPGNPTAPTNWSKIKDLFR
jgi:hypothetical protein